MSLELGPATAAGAASGVYDILLNSSPADLARAQERFYPKEISTNFHVKSAQIVQGRSGVGITSTTGFVVANKGKDQRSGEVLLTFRGTATGYDAVTDAYTLISPGADASGVHAGFQKCYKSVAADVESYVSDAKPKQVHLVGHSLGGALATLAANSIAGRRIPVKLYTFGSPRVGLASFATQVDGRVGINNIFRCYHSADPVAMIPIFPFHHVSVARGGYRVEWPGDPVSPYAHKIDEYHASVGDQSWQGIGRVRNPFASAVEAEAWLERAANPAFAIPTMSSRVLETAGQALNLIVQFVAGMAILSTIVAETAIDWVAALIARGVQLSVRIGVMAANFIRICLKLLGMAADFAADSASVIATMLKRVLELLMLEIGASARRAVELVLR